MDAYIHMVPIFMGWFNWQLKKIQEQALCTKYLVAINLGSVSSIVCFIVGGC